MSTVPDTRLTATETPTVSQEDCLAQLSGVVREDYEAVAVDGVPVNEQARRRGVYPSTVSTNVKRGHERIASFIGDQPGVTTTPRDSYDVDVKHVGGREPDGEPTTIGHWTFQTRMVREVVRDTIVLALQPPHTLGTPPTHLRYRRPSGIPREPTLRIYTHHSQGNHREMIRRYSWKGEREERVTGPSQLVL